MSTRSTLSLTIAEQLEKRIISGAWEAGTQIPNEQQLMEEFNVSRITVRESIKSLASRGILEIRRGKGTFVSLTPGLSDDPLGLRFLSSDKSLGLNMAEARYILEPELCRLAALRADDEEIAQLRILVDELDELDYRLKGEDTPDPVIQALLTRDLEFHTCLCRMTRNPVLARMLPAVLRSLDDARELIRQRVITSPRLSTHRAIYEAIRTHDGERARLLMRQHLDSCWSMMCASGAGRP